MSECADFDRSTDGMKALFADIHSLLEHFFEIAIIDDPTQLAQLFRLYDMLLTQQATLSAMLCSAQTQGTHGSAFVDRQPNQAPNTARKTRTLTQGAHSKEAAVSPLPNPELWFETLLAQTRKEKEL